MIVYLIGIFICCSTVYVWWEIDELHDDLADIMLRSMVAIFCGVVWPVFLLVLVLNVIVKRIAEKLEERGDI